VSSPAIARSDTATATSVTTTAAGHGEPATLQQPVAQGLHNLIRVPTYPRKDLNAMSLQEHLQRARHGTTYRPLHTQLGEARTALLNADLRQRLAVPIYLVVVLVEVDNQHLRGNVERRGHTSLPYGYRNPHASGISHV